MRNFRGAMEGECFKFPCRTAVFLRSRRMFLRRTTVFLRNRCVFPRKSVTFLRRSSISTQNRRTESIPPTVSRMLGWGHACEDLTNRQEEASTRGSMASWVSDGKSVGNSISRKPPGQMVVLVGGARKTWLDLMAWYLVVESVGP